MGLKKVLVMAGGTGGHVFPGLAIAHYLRKQGIDVHWMGTAAGLEAELVPAANLPLHLVKISGVRGKGLRTLLSAPSKISQAVWQARRILKQIQPDVVLGMGGFVSGPGGIASWLTGYPLIIHEQNAKAGMTNKILQTFSQKVLEAFPASFPSRKKVILIGNPVRDEIEQLTPPQLRLKGREQALRLLVLGGSLGAEAINTMLPQALALLKSNERPTVLHQTGSKHFELTKKRYESSGITVTLKPFIKDMAEAYAWADVVLCRSGALTVSELCAAGLGAIFIPYPYAVDDHQTANAQFMVTNKAALCLQQRELEAAQLAALIGRLSHSPDQCFNMACAAYQLRKVNVVDKIFEICKEVCP